MIAAAEDILYGVALVVFAVGFVVAVALKKSRIEASLGPLSVEVSQINKAVNHVEPGEAPLIQRVRDLEASDKWKNDALVAIAHQLGVHLPPHPKETK